MRTRLPGRAGRSIIYLVYKQHISEKNVCRSLDQHLILTWTAFVLKYSTYVRLTFS
jgi:hypothetical protein